MDDKHRVPTSTPLSGWLAELSRPTGAPGGGAASGVMLGLAAALLRMVAEYTPDDEQASECAGRLAARRAEALEAAEADGVRSTEFGAALALSVDDPNRGAQIRDAAIAAARSSLLLGEVGSQLIPELRLLAGIGNPALRADLIVAAEALGAGIAGASVNLRANMQTARRHDAPPAIVADLESDLQRLVVDRRIATRVADEASDAFDVTADER